MVDSRDSTMIDVRAGSSPLDDWLTEMKSPSEDNNEFDRFAHNYEALFKPWLKIAGASREFFARERLRWLSTLLTDSQITPKRVMDFGCGTGMSLLLLTEVLGAEQVIGLDTSEDSLAVAAGSVANRSVQLATPREFVPRGDIDLIFCNGVFHHIPVAERPEVMEYIYQCLRPGGVFALWENNPWNPVQLLAMKLAKLDRNAVPVSSPETHRLMSFPPFQVIRTDYLFFFPGWLGWARPLEKWMRNIPLGAQYQVLARKAK